MNFSTPAHDHVIRCSACGAPLPPPDGSAVAAATHCPFCNATMRVETAPPCGASFGLPSAPFAPFAPSAGPSPLSSLTGFRFTGLMMVFGALPLVGVLAAVGPMLSAFHQASAIEVAGAPSVQVDPEPPAAAVGTPPPATPVNSAEPRVAPAASGLASEPVELVWGGRVTSSKGDAPRVGSTCTLAALVVPSGTAVESKRTTLVCAGKTLYDSAVPLNGMANAFFTLEEKRAPGEAASFVYQLGAEDVGTRSGRAQLMVYTPKNKLDAFTEGASPFHVQVQIAPSSAVRSGKPLLEETLKAPPAAAATAAAPPKNHSQVTPPHRQAARPARR